MRCRDRSAHCAIPIEQRDLAALIQERPTPLTRYAGSGTACSRWIQLIQASGLQSRLLKPD